MKNLLEKKYIYFGLLSLVTFQIHGASGAASALHSDHYAGTGPSLRGVLVGALALIGGAQAAPSNFEVVAQKTYPDGAFGPGYPVTYRLVSSHTPYETFVMVADHGAIEWGNSYLQHGEFTDAFVGGRNVLELAYGHGYHVDRMLTNELSLVDISDSNTANIRKKLKSHSKRQPKDIQHMGLKASTFLDGKVTVYDAMDARDFLEAARAEKLPLYDTVGAFHLMHFWTPTEILRAVHNIHTILKPNGTFVITLSSPEGTSFLEYGKESITQPWAGSAYCDPALYSHFKRSSGHTKGMVPTILPAPALADLLKAFGFEIVKSGSYSDFYYENIGTPATEFVDYEGVIARKMGGINYMDLARWKNGATSCEKIVADEDTSTSAKSIRPNYATIKALRDMEEKRRLALFWQHCYRNQWGISCNKA